MSTREVEIQSDASVVVEREGEQFIDELRVNLNREVRMGADRPRLPSATKTMASLRSSTQSPSSLTHVAKELCRAIRNRVEAFEGLS